MWAARLLHERHCRIGGGRRRGHTCQRRPRGDAVGEVLSGGAAASEKDAKEASRTWRMDDASGVLANIGVEGDGEGGRGDDGEEGKRRWRW